MTLHARPAATATPFVGREAALDHLAGALAAARTGRFAGVIVSGPSGIGKSRLVERFTAHVSVGHHLAAGAHPDDGEIAPLEPVRQLLRSQPPEAGLAQPGVEAESKEHVFRTVADTFERLADAEAPLLLTIEDLHWADTTTLEFVGYLGRRLARHPVLLLATMRDGPDLTPQLARLLVALERDPNTTRLSLEPLDVEEGRRLLAERTGRPPDDVTLEEVLTRAEGLPLFLEELGDALTRGETDTLPRSLRELIHATMATLDPATRGLLELAAVCGRGFEHRLLSDVAERSTEELERGTGLLLDQGLLIRDANGTGYRFRHALVREAILEHLRPATRQRLHALCAQAMAADPTLVPEDRSPADELAYHWGRAGAAAPTFLATLDAADEARDRRAYAEALRRELDAATLLDRLGPDERGDHTRAALLARAASSAGHLGDHAHEAALLDEALSCDPEPESRSRLHVDLTRARFLAGDRLGAARAATAATAELTPGDESPTRAILLALSASFRTDLRDPSSVVRVTEEALEEARRCGDPDALTEVLCLHGLALAEAGQDRGADAALAEAEQVGTDVDEPRMRLRPTVYRLLTRQRMGRDHDVLALAHEALLRAEHLGVASSVGQQLRVPLVDALLAQGRFDEAAAAIDDGLAWGGRGWPGLALTAARAEVAIHRGHLAVAASELEAMLAGADDHRPEPRGSSAAAELAWWRKDVSASRAHASRGLELATGTSGPDELGGLTFRLVRATHAARGGASASDRARANAAIESLGSLDDRPLVAAWHATAAAEATDPSDTTPGMWDAVGDRWGALQRLPMVAWSAWRSATHHLAIGADDAARERLELAQELAASLGTQPLLLEVRSRLGTNPTAVTEPAAGRVIGGTAALPDLGLTPREVEVLRLVAEGWSNKRIAAELVVSPRTVSTHVSRLLGKLEVESRGQAAAVAHRLGVTG